MNKFYIKNGNEYLGLDSHDNIYFTKDFSKAHSYPSLKLANETFENYRTCLKVESERLSNIRNKLSIIEYEYKHIKGEIDA